MALTATAAKKTRCEISRILGMINPYIIEVSPDRPNVFLARQNFLSIVETFQPIC